MIKKEDLAGIDQKDQNDGFRWQEVVYRGRRMIQQLASGKGTPESPYRYKDVMIYKWAVLDTGQEFNYPGEKRGENNIAVGAVIGGVYWVCRNDNTVYTGGSLKPKYSYRLELDEVAEWCAFDSNTSMLKSQLSCQKRESRRNLIKETLAPLNEVYCSLNRRQRALFLSEVISYICHDV